MKKTLAVTLVLFISLVFSCEMEKLTGVEEPEIPAGGGVTITLPVGNAPAPVSSGSRAISEALRAAASPADVARFDAILADPDAGTSRTISGQPGETLLFQGVKEGLFTLTLNAYDAAGVMLFTGSTTVTVKNGETAKAHIILDHVTGEIGIEISFPLNLKGVDRLGPFNASPADHLISNMTFGASVAMSDNGDYAVLWRRDTTSSALGYFMKLYHADGTPKCEPVQVATIAESDYYYMPRLGMDRNGNVVIAYVEQRQVSASGYARFHMVKMFSADATLLKTFQVNNGFYADKAPGFAMNADGDFIVGSLSTDGIHLNMFRADGTRRTDEIQFENDYSNENPPDISMDSTGNFVVAYDYGAYGTFRIRKYSKQGALLVTLSGIPMLDREGRPQVTINDHGYFAALWAEYNVTTPSLRRLVMQTFNPDGTPASPLIPVSNNPGIATLGIREQSGFDITFKNTWELAATWVQYTVQTSGAYARNTQVVLQRYFIDGSGLSSATGLSDEAGAATTTSEKYTYMAPRIACARNSNHYIVGWANLITGRIQYSLLTGDNF